jgi:glycine amidinotransferase
VYGQGSYSAAFPLANCAPLITRSSALSKTRLPERAAGPGNAVNSWAEWHPLEEIVVGRVERSCLPHNEPAFEAKLRFADHDAALSKGGIRCDAALEKGAEELEGLVSVLEAHNVVVQRPEIVDWTVPTATPDFAVPCGNTGAMPRDVLLTVGNEIVEAPMSWRARFFEYRAYRELLNGLFERDPTFLWTAGPKPTMSDRLYHADYPHEARGEGANCVRSQLAEARVYCHTEAEPIFDAADVMRLGKDLFVCNSFTTNRKGYDWIRRHFNRRGLRVHFVDFPADTAPMHLDVNLVPLRAGLVMTNPARPPRPWVEKMLRDNGWEIIVGTSSGLEPPPMSQCSQWLALNVLSIDERTVLVEAEEHGVMELLSKHGIEPVPVPLRSIAEFGGAFHCCTADVRRRGRLESYFPHLDELEAAGLDCQFAPFGSDAPAVYDIDAARDGTL